MVMPPDPAKLRHRFAIQQKLKRSGDGGAPKSEHVDVGRIRGSLESVAGRELEQSNARFAAATHIIESRHTPCLREGHRLVGMSPKVHGKIFDITWVDDVDYMGVKDRIFVTELK